MKLTQRPDNMINKQGKIKIQESKIMDKFSYWENYISMFLFLDKIYEENKQFEDLGGLLGSMDPYLFTDNTPADCALLKDWLDIKGYYDKLCKGVLMRA